MKITASIVTHKTPPYQLQKCLESIARYPVERTYVVDNSPDSTLRALAEASGAEYLHVENRGFGAGHNVAIKKAINLGADYHLVVNADVCWEIDAIGILAAYMEANPNVGLSAPRIIYPDGTLQYSCRLLPTPIDLFAKRFLPGFLTKKRLQKYLLTEADHKKILFPSYLTGCFLLFRIKALKQTGLFDERFFMYPEDIDITRRIHENWLTAYYPMAEVEHRHEGASRKFGKMLFVHAANMIKYFNKWGWMFDEKRKKYNREMLRNMPLQKEPFEAGRG